MEPEERWVLYYAIENDTPRNISNKFKINVDQVQYDDRQLEGYEHILLSSKLEKNIIIVVPLSTSEQIIE